MKKFLWGFLFVSLCAQADVKISALPVGSAAASAAPDSVAVYSSISNQTQQILLSDLLNIPAFQAQFSLMIPTQFGNSGKCLGTNGTVTSWVTCGSGASALTVVNGGDTNYAIQPTDGHIRSSTPLTAPRTYTLDSCTAGNIGETHSIKNDSTQGFNLTVAGNSGDQIDHSGTYVLSPGSALPVICVSATNWDIRQ